LALFTNQPVCSAHARRLAMAAGKLRLSGFNDPAEILRDVHRRALTPRK
jgi:hypothetical protein